MAKAFECSNCQHVQTVGVIDNGRAGFADPQVKCEECGAIGSFNFAPGHRQRSASQIAEAVARMEAWADTLSHEDFKDLNPKSLSELRAEFRAGMLKLADEYEALDHTLSPDGKGTELQHDVRRLREFARELAKNHQLLKP